MMSMNTNRGFSPVIAVVLMVAVAVAASVITYLWGTGLVSSVISSTDASTITTNARISIEEVNTDFNVAYLRCKGDQTRLLDAYVTTSAGNSKKLQFITNKQCGDGNTSLIDINFKTDFDTNFGILPGYFIRIVGTNNAEAIRAI